MNDGPEVSVGDSAGVAPGAANRRRVGQKWLGLGDVPCLWTFRAVDDLELDRLTLFK
jgi:hypothetical protein